MTSVLCGGIDPRSAGLRGVSPSPGCSGWILATGVRREFRAIKTRRASPTAQCGSSAKVCGDALPVVVARSSTLPRCSLYQGGIRVASYTASKSGIAGITRLLANEWADRGVNVNAIAPGYIETRNTSALQRDPQRNAGAAPRFVAMLCQSWRWAQDAGKCSTIRRTEDSTQAPSFIRCSRRVLT